MGSGAHERTEGSAPRAWSFMALLTLAGRSPWPQAAAFSCRAPLCPRLQQTHRAWGPSAGGSNACFGNRWVLAWVSLSRKQSQLYPPGRAILRGKWALGDDGHGGHTQGLAPRRCSVTEFTLSLVYALKQDGVVITSRGAGVRRLHLTPDSSMTWSCSRPPQFLI